MRAITNFIRRFINLLIILEKLGQIAEKIKMQNNPGHKVFKKWC
jgi:hypothetical protein